MVVSANARFRRREQQLQKVFVSAFQQHWRRILRQLEEGGPSLADERWRCFEADTAARRKGLARRFYSLEHARAMAQLNEAQILKAVSCYLPAAIRSALSDSFYEPVAVSRGLPAAEYVLFVCNRDVAAAFVVNGQGDDDAWSVRSYPSNAYYDDWYDMTFGGVGDGGAFIIAKSTGESFNRHEREWLRMSIFNNIRNNMANEYDDDKLWRYTFVPIGTRLIGFQLVEEDDESRYLAELFEGVGRLKTSDLRVFLGHLLERLRETLSGSPSRFRHIEKQLTARVVARKTLVPSLVSLVTSTAEAERKNFVRQIEHSANDVFGSGREIVHPVDEYAWDCYPLLP